MWSLVAFFFLKKEHQEKTHREGKKKIDGGHVFSLKLEKGLCSLSVLFFTCPGRRAVLITNLLFTTTGYDVSALWWRSTIWSLSASISRKSSFINNIEAFSVSEWAGRLLIKLQRTWGVNEQMASSVITPYCRRISGGMAGLFRFLHMILFTATKAKKKPWYSLCKCVVDNFSNVVLVFESPFVWIPFFFFKGKLWWRKTCYVEKWVGWLQENLKNKFGKKNKPLFFFDLLLRPFCKTTLRAIAFPVTISSPVLLHSIKLT